MKRIVFAAAVSIAACGGAAERVQLPVNVQMDIAVNNATVTVPHACSGVVDTRSWAAAFACHSDSGASWAVNGVAEHHEGLEVVQLYLWTSSRAGDAQPDIAIDFEPTSDSARFAGWATIITPASFGSGVPGAVATAVVRR
jgi:hypothetical protein